MQKNLEDYLDENRIEFIEENGFILIGGVKFLHISPIDGLILDKNNRFPHEKRSDNVIFEFGGNFYYSKFEKFELNELRYLGDNTYLISDNSFIGVHGGMDILKGSRQYHEWVKKAKFLGIKNLGIAELDTLAGTMKFQIECNKSGIKPIIGMQVTVLDSNESKHLVNLYTKNEIGWSNLLRINKVINVDNQGKPITNLQLRKFRDGLSAVYNVNTITYTQYKSESRLSNNFSISLVRFKSNKLELDYLKELKKFINDDSLKPILLTNAYYLEKHHSRVKKELKQIAKIPGKIKEFNEYFHTNEEILFYYEDRTNNCQDLFERSLLNLEELVSGCKFEIQQGARNLPKYKMNESEITKYGKDGQEDLFWDLIQSGASKKIPKDKTDEYLKRIDTEWEVIEYGNVMDYFLILWDIVKWARSQGILVGDGRGSAAGSLVSYLLDITKVDPIEYDLLFERFLNKGRVEKSLPDIDVDFSGHRRNEVKEYIISKYGYDYFCSVGTYTNLKPKSLIKEIGKLNGHEHKDLNYITTLMGDSDEFIDIFNEAQKVPQIKNFVLDNVGIINECRLMNLQPKAESVHACATIIVPDGKQIYEWIPVKLMNKGGEHILVSQWEGGELESAGFLKEDILGILQLDKYEMIINLIKDECGVEIDLHSIPVHDESLYEYFRKGWNSDIFHFGSVGLTGYCKEMLPDNIEDLIAALSLYRPGPMENGFHKQYIKRKNGDEEVYHFPNMESITKKTFGILCYQEQIMQTCVTIGGLPLSNADDIRKSMVKKRVDEIEKYSVRFHEHAISELGMDPNVVEDIWKTLLKFASYGFNRSHAASYTIIAVYGMWFKVNYPLQFWSTAFSFGDDKTYPRFLSEINKIGGIKVRSVDINLSGSTVNSDIETNALYWSLNSVKQCGDKSYSQIVEDRELNGEYLNFDNFLTRHVRKGSKVNKAVIENLIICGAFDNIELISDITDRYALVEFYHNYSKFKGDPSVKFTNPDSKIWWSLKQRELCGLSIIDFFDIKSENFNKKDWDTPSEFDLYGDGSIVNVCGYVQDVIIRNIRGGKKMATIMLDNNYENFTITIWDKELRKFKKLIEDSKNKVLLFRGVLKYDNYHKEIRVFSGRETILEVKD